MRPSGFRLNACIDGQLRWHQNFLNLALQVFRFSLL
jgi:hypothetical protein